MDRKDSFAPADARIKRINKVKTNYRLRSVSRRASIDRGSWRWHQREHCQIRHAEVQIDKLCLYILAKHLSPKGDQKFIHCWRNSSVAFRNFLGVAYRLSLSHECVCLSKQVCTFVYQIKIETDPPFSTKCYSRYKLPFNFVIGDVVPHDLDRLFEGQRFESRTS